MTNACDTLELLRGGEQTAEQHLNACLTRIAATEPDLNAWVVVDKDGALDVARACDERKARGDTLPALHGLPVGLKDIFDTAGLPTELGSPIHKDRQPLKDGTVVERLRKAGAIVLGKTVTTEFAYLHPSITRNPHNAAYTPGGSSSGSAVAVAAGQVPLALGSQTGGSVIRPASFCGVYGFKPSRGLLSRHGVLQTSETLDHVGMFARSVADLMLLTDAIKGFDAADPASFDSAVKSSDSDTGDTTEAVQTDPRLVFIDMPYADRYSTALNTELDRVLGMLNSKIERIPAPPLLAELPQCHKTIYDYEIYRCLKFEREQHEELLSDTAQIALKRAAKVTAENYSDALDTKRAGDKWFSDFFNTYDAIVTPSATGIAPRVEEGTTGDAICCVTWTLAGLPCVSLPLLTGEKSMPMGLQLVSAHRADDALLQYAGWFDQFMRS